MTAVARRTPGAPTAGREQVSGRPDLVRRQVARRIREGHEAGMVVTQSPPAYLPDGQVVVEVEFHPGRPMLARPIRTWRFWLPVGVGALLAFGALLWAAVVVLKAVIAAIVAIATAALGAAVLIGGIIVLANVRGGGGTWTGSGTWW